MRVLSSLRAVCKYVIAVCVSLFVVGACSKFCFGGLQMQTYFISSLICVASLVLRLFHFCASAFLFCLCVVRVVAGSIFAHAGSKLRALISRVFCRVFERFLLKPSTSTCCFFSGAVCP